MIHIHNGDIVAQQAKRAGIAGDHVAFRESLISGPVVPGEDWIESRARALADRYNDDLLRVRTAVLEQEQMLDQASSRGEIVLWFEHDLFCLVHLIYVLNRLGAGRISTVWSPTPLSNFEDRDLFLRFESRRAVTPMMLNAARTAWRAYISSDPTALNQLLSREAPDFPFMREGFALHASRFPSTQNGLGAIEQRILGVLSSGSLDFVALFPQVDTDPPKYGFGDSEVLATLRGLAGRGVPLIMTSGQGPKTLYSITPAGEKVLHGEIDDSSINDPDQWLGGTHLTKENLWRWDGTTLSPSPVS